MLHKIELTDEKKLIGIHLTMSFSDYKVVTLWKSFMPRRHEIKNNLNNELFSMSIYKPDFFEDFNPTAKFEKWSAIEVTDFDTVPEKMETFLLKGGLYAVFNYKGSSSDNTIFKYILWNWLPNSEYTLDIRPHFEVLGDKFKSNEPSSEEEIWIPIKPK